MSEGVKQKPNIIFRPSGRRGYVNDGETIKEASEKLGIDIEGICGGKAICGKCKVKVEKGFFQKYGVKSRMESLSLISEAEKKTLTLRQQSSGYRLACQARIHGDVVVFVPGESRVSRQIVRKVARDIAIELKPAVRKYYVEMVPETLHDGLSDWERV